MRTLTGEVEASRGMWTPSERMRQAVGNFQERCLGSRGFGQNLQEEALERSKTAGGNVSRVAPRETKGKGKPGSAGSDETQAQAGSGKADITRYFVLLLRP